MQNVALVPLLVRVLNAMLHRIRYAIIIKAHLSNCASYSHPHTWAHTNHLNQYCLLAIPLRASQSACHQILYLSQYNILNSSFRCRFTFSDYLSLYVLYFILMSFLFHILYFYQLLRLPVQSSFLTRTRCTLYTRQTNTRTHKLTV